MYTNEILPDIIVIDVPSVAVWMEPQVADSDTPKAGLGASRRLSIDVDTECTNPMMKLRAQQANIAPVQAPEDSCCIDNAAPAPKKKIPKFGAAIVKCRQRHKAVYSNDAQIALKDGPVHKACAKCADCSCQLTIANCTTAGDDLLCKTHYFARFHKTNKYS